MAASPGIGKARSVTFDIDLSPDEFKTEIRGLYPVLRNVDFRLNILDYNKRFIPVPFSTIFFKEKNYQGTVVIEICDKKELM